VAPDSADKARGAEEFVPDSIARIRRLERLEVERLRSKEELAERRRQHVAGVKLTGGRHDIVDRVERVTKYPLSLLGVAWLVLLVVVVSVHLASTTKATLLTIVFVIWVVLFAEYGFRLALSPARGQYVRRRWVEPVTVVVPVAETWHLFGLEKITLVLHEMSLRILSILSHHNLARVMLGAAGVVFAGAFIVMLFEKSLPQSNIHDYSDALWWAVVTVTTVGYGDKFPFTEGGRVVAVVLMLVGIGLIGTLTATVASVFVKEHTDATKDEVSRRHDDLQVQITRIDQLLQDIDRRVGGSPDAVTAAEDADGTAPATS
jgi:voltage-gated potassium channel